LAIFPGEDKAFARFVQLTRQGLIAESRAVEPASLEAALRRFHTRATVMPQASLATLGGPVWYVYRDGHAGVRVEQDWWRQPEIAEIVVHSVSREILEANDAACALVDMAPGQLVGWDPSRLVQVLEPAVAAGFRELLDAQGWLQSVFDFPRADGGFRVIEYHTRTTDDPSRLVSYWRELAVIRPTPTPTQLGFAPA
jgi:PAS domain-containing protein